MYNLEIIFALSRFFLLSLYSSCKKLSFVLAILNLIAMSSFANISNSLPSSRVLVNSIVGEYSGGFITSRYVNMSYFLEASLFTQRRNDSTIKLYSADSKAFTKEVTAVLIERVVYEDSKNFSNIQVTGSEIANSISSFNKKFSNHPEWKKLAVKETELKDLIMQKLMSKKYIKFKAESSIVPITRDEARMYFEENRAQFGELPFENFEQNIRAFLGRKQADKRIKEWFEVLQNKFKVRNLLVETF
jgi:hypothetical protein